MSPADATLCLYRRSAGRSWWRVDVFVTPAGDIDIVSGDGNEWHAIVRGSENRDRLLGALRRTGDLTACIGATPEEEILARLFEAFHRSTETENGPFEEIKAFLDDNGIVWEAQFWSDDEGGTEPKPAADLLSILMAARLLLSRPDNDFTWSSWEDRDAALAEVDGLIADMKAGAGPDVDTIRLLFSVTGPLQEVSLSSGWAERFVLLAERVDGLVG